MRGENPLRPDCEDFVGKVEDLRVRCSKRARASARLHPERIKINSALYYRRHRDKVLEYSRNYYLEHAEDRSLYHRKYYRCHWQECYERLKTYQKEHPDVVFRVHWGRRARQSSSDGSFTLEEFRTKCEEFGNKCSYCGASNVALEPDHIVALSRGGNNDISNIVPACRSCNSSKGAGDVEQFKFWLEFVVGSEKCH